MGATTFCQQTRLMLCASKRHSFSSRNNARMVCRKYNLNQSIILSFHHPSLQVHRLSIVEAKEARSPGACLSVFAIKCCSRMLLPLGIVYSLVFLEMKLHPIGDETWCGPSRSSSTSSWSHIVSRHLPLRRALLRRRTLCDSRSPLPAPPVLASETPKHSEKLHLHHVLGE